MSMLSVGDMALSFQMRKQNAELKQQLIERNKEVITGQAYDLGKRVTGDFMSLAAVDRSLAMLDAYDTAATEAELYATTAQAALGVVTDGAQEIAPLLLSSVTNSSYSSQEAVAKDARQKLEASISALNTQVAGRYAFSGVTTDVAPLIDAETLIAELSTATVGATDSASFVAAVDAWFAAPAGGGGFLDLAYNGSDTQLDGFRIGPDETARARITAADEPIRNVIKGLAMAAMLDEGLFGNNVPVRGQIAVAAGSTILSADSGLVGLRAELGTVESQIAAAQTRNSAERAALEIARVDQIAVDPYDTAAALEALTVQMETLYTLTARISDLTFVDFMR